jgi:LemA protein
MYILLCLGLLLVLVVGAALFLMAIYNSLVSLRNLLEEGWSGIDVQLKRRYDLVPNLVETVKGYAKHEKETFEKVVQLRNSAMSAKGPEEKGKAENAFTESIKSIFALAEAYPDLKANQNFQSLQSELSKIEDDLQNARRYYNATVRNFNMKIQQFPSNLVANMFGFKEREFFEAMEEEKQNVKVDFSEEKKEGDEKAK